MKKTAQRILELQSAIAKEEQQLQANYVKLNDQIGKLKGKSGVVCLSSTQGALIDETGKVKRVPILVPSLPTCPKCGSHSLRTASLNKYEICCYGCSYEYCHPVTYLAWEGFFKGLQND